MADVQPKKPLTPAQKVAHIVRQFRASERGISVAAWRALERVMQSEGLTWTDIGSLIERGESKFSEEDVLELVQAARAETRAEAIEEGIKLGKARAHNGGGGNGHGGYTLPGACEMAQYCNDRAGHLKDDKQRQFISDMQIRTQRGAGLSRNQLKYLVSLFIEHGGRI